MAHFLHLSHLPFKEQDTNIGLSHDFYSEKATNNCSINDCNYNETGLDVIPTIFSLASCSLSCLGSVLIVVSYFALKGIRNVAQKIITVLAVADFFTALGYILAGWNFLANRSPGRCGRFTDVCEVQSFITSWSSLSSFGWSCALALHFYLLLTVKRKSRLVKLFNWENLLFWLFPVLILIPLLVTHNLGYSHMAVSNWCFIRHQEGRSFLVEVFLVLVGGKFWEILSYIFVIVVYTLTRRKFNRHLRTEASEEQPILPSSPRDEPQRSSAQEARSEARNRLHIIPLTFVLLRMWGTLQFIYSVVRVKNSRCLHTSADYVVLKIIGVIQAVGDGGQGWSNALIYIFLSPTIRRQLFLYPLVRLIIFLTKKMTRTNTDKEGDTRPPSLHVARRQHTQGPYSSTAQEYNHEDNIFDGEDSSIEAEMTSVTNGH